MQFRPLLAFFIIAYIEKQNHLTTGSINMCY